MHVLCRDHGILVNHRFKYWRMYGKSRLSVSLSVMSVNPKEVKLMHHFSITIKSEIEGDGKTEIISCTFADKIFTTIDR